MELPYLMLTIVWTTTVHFRHSMERILRFLGIDSSVAFCNTRYDATVGQNVWRNFLTHLHGLYQCFGPCDGFMIPALCPCFDENLV